MIDQRVRLADEARGAANHVQETEMLQKHERLDEMERIEAEYGL